MCKVPSSTRCSTVWIDVSDAWHSVRKVISGTVQKGAATDKTKEMKLSLRRSQPLSAHACDCE